MATQESRYEDALQGSITGVVSVKEGGEGRPSRVVSDDAAVCRSHPTSLERDDSIEWQVFQDPSTASIRHKLFEKSVSIEPGR